MIALAIAAAAAVAQPKVVAIIPPEHRVVEGVATDGSTIWVSSVIDRQIVACTAGCRTLALLPQGLHPLGIAWDWGRKLIWIAADCPGIPGTPTCQKGALVAVDRYGRLRGRIAPKADTFHPGDVSASATGVFVSDSRNGLIYALRPRRPGLNPVNQPGDGKSAQGTAMTPDGVALAVADYGRGFGVVDLGSKTTTWLPRKDGKPLRGLDGLVRCGDRFFAVHNGDAPGQVLTIRMHPGGVTAEPLASGLKLPEPTQIAYDGRKLLIVSNAGWEAATKGGVKRFKGAPIIAISLTRGCEAR